MKPDNSLKTLDQTLQIGIFQTEPVVKGKVLFINKFGSDLLGYDSPDKVVGEKLGRFFANAAEHIKIMNRFLGEESIGSECEFVCKRRDGLESLAAMTGTLVKDSDGDNLRIDGTIRNVQINEEEKLENEIVLNISKILVANLYLNEVYQKICDELHRSVKWDRVSILLREGIKNKSSGVIDFAVMTKGLKKGAVGSQFQEKKSHSAIGSILENIVTSKKPVIVSDTRNNILNTDKFFAEDGLLSRFAYPLIMRDKIIGCIAFSTKSVDYYNENHIKLLEKIAPFLSIAIENSRIHFKATKSEKEYNELFKTIDSPWL